MRANSNISFLSDDSGMLRSLTSMKVGGETEIKYPATFHIGFGQASGLSGSWGVFSVMDFRTHAQFQSLRYVERLKTRLRRKFEQVEILIIVR